MNLSKSLTASKGMNHVDTWPQTPAGRFVQQVQRRQASTPPSAASFFVSDVPTLPNIGEQFQIYAGALPARTPEHAAENAHIYFQLHKAKHNADRRRLLMWMNGGPGCSSFDGIMMEVGAWRTKADETGLEWAPVGGVWNEYVDVLYSKRSSYFIAESLIETYFSLLELLQQMGSSRPTRRDRIFLCCYKCLCQVIRASC